MNYEPFTRDDHNDLQNTEKIVGCVGSSHYGLGLRAALLVAAVLGNGALLQVGDKGCGKTVCIDAVFEWARELGSGKLSCWDKEITMAGADKYFNKFFSGKKVLWISQDLAKLSPTVQEGMLKVVAAINQDHKCIVKTSMYYIDIRDCNLAWLAACAFDIYNQIWQIPAWRGSYSDRILRLIIFPYRRQVNLAAPIIPKFKNAERAEVVRDKWFYKVVNMLESQFGYERAYDYAGRYLCGIARTNGRTETTPADAKFFLLFSINIEAERLIGSRNELTSPLFIDTDALYLFSECLKHKKVTASQVKARTKVIDETIIDEIVSDYPQFFKKAGSYIIANHEFVSGNLRPQKEFEEECVRKWTMRRK